MSKSQPCSIPDPHPASFLATFAQVRRRLELVKMLTAIHGCYGLQPCKGGIGVKPEPRGRKRGAP